MGAFLSLGEIKSELCARASISLVALSQSGAVVSWPGTQRSVVFIFTGTVSPTSFMGAGERGSEQTATAVVCRQGYRMYSVKQASPPFKPLPPTHPKYRTH